MDNEKRVPKLRFPGFTDAWEQRKLGDEAIEILAGGDIDKDKAMKNGKYPIYANALTNDGIVGYYDDYYRVKAPAVTVTGRGEVGHAQARITDFTPVVRLLAVRSSHDCYFLENAINNHKVVVESTGVPQLTVPQLSSYNIFFPINIEEESKIGQFFHSIDNLITLHQRWLEHTKELKSSLLKKIFPKDDEKFPEIRFPEFTDAWEQRKLGDVTEEFRSGSFIPASDISDKGEYPVYGGNGLRGYTNTYNHDGEFALIGRQGALCGNMNYSVGKAYFTEHAVAVKANSLSDTKFLYYLLSIMRLGQYSAQSAQPGLAVGKLINLQNMFPRGNEQHRIGEFFSNLDNLITLHQRKLDHLKQLKKGFLQQMFV